MAGSTGVVQPECARPTPARPLARRPILFAIAGGALLTTTTGLLAGCGSDQPDPLRLLAEHARSDAAMIDGMRMTNSLEPDVAAMMTDIAAARLAHAQSLDLALGNSESDGASPTSSNPTPAGQSAADALYRVRQALDNARDAAGQVVLTVPRQHAGLVGSVAACCAAYRSVLG
jgi:hypothetical protein